METVATFGATLGAQACERGTATGGDTLVCVSMPTMRGDTRLRYYVGELADIVAVNCEQNPAQIAYWIAAHASFDADYAIEAGTGNRVWAARS